MSNTDNKLFLRYFIVLVFGVLIGAGGLALYLVPQLNNISSKVGELKSINNQLSSEVDNLKSVNDALGAKVKSLSDRVAELSVRSVSVSQEEGKIVYWILPGFRRLSPSVFGTPDNPMFGNDRLEWAINVSSRLPQPLGSSVPELLRKLPFLVAAPEEMRGFSPEGDYILKVPTLFSDKARIVSGSMSIEFIDKVPYDTMGPPINTSDVVNANITFTDPSGNNYKLVVKHVFMPPLPGYETGGGVLLNAWHHGTTGTGSPLMPKLFTYAAFWAFGDIVVDGEVIEQNVVIHGMTTQVVRDKNYRLMLDEELPLNIDNTPAGQLHHTHIVVFPIQITKNGPVYHPLNLPFILPNGKPQPFIHVMFEQDVISGATFSNVPEFGVGNSSNASITIKVSAQEWFYTPNRISVEKGQVITIIFINNGTIPHNLFIDGYNLTTDTINPGDKYTLTFVADVAGEFVFWCTVPGHKDQGLRGVLIVNN